MLRVAKILLGSFLVMGCLASASVAGSLSFDFDLPADHVQVGTHNGATTVRIDDRAFALLSDPGQPVLPYRLVNVLLPQGDDVATFKVDAGSERVIARSAWLEHAGTIVTEDGKTGHGPALASAEGSMFPSVRARFLSTGTLHGYTIATFAVFPVRVSGDDVVASDHLTLHIETTASTRPAPVLLERRSPQVRARALEELQGIVVNPADAGRYAFAEVEVPKRRGGFQPTAFPSLEGSAVDYVIVTPDSLAATYQVLADFKTAKGVPTVVRTTEWIAANYRNGSDIQETIRNFVKDAYQKWGITYLLVGGDTKEVPPRLAFSNFYDGGQFLAADMYLGCLDGDWNADHDDVFGEESPTGIDNPDLYAEVYVGRLPSDSAAEAAMMINKIITYETPTNMSYAKRVLLLGEVLFPMPWTPPAPITLNGADLINTPIYTSYLQGPGLNVVRMYETEELFPPAVDENRVAVIDSLNNGFNHVIHVGHGYRFNMSVGDVSMTNSDADALHNGNKLSCLYFLNCTGAAYTYSCLAEHFLRNSNGGAVSVIGANNSAFPNASTFYMNEYYRLLFQKGNVHIGRVFADSRLPRTGLASSGDYIDLWTHYIYTLLADPEMPMWTAPVTTLSLAMPASVTEGTHAITVTVTSGGNPVDSATVCLSKSDEDYQVGTTNGSGQCTLTFRAETAGSITVVATGRNHARKTGTISVTNGAAYVNINSIGVTDTNGGGSSGNGNGVIEGGETIGFSFSLRNTGSASTGTVTCTLRCADPAVTLVDSTAGGGVLAPGGTGTQTGGCWAAFSENTPDEHAAAFTLIIKNNGVETWRDTFKKTIHQPKIDLVRLRIDDSVTGNNDGVVQAGEQFKLYYKIKNFGTGAFPGGTITVTDLDAGFTLISPSASYATAASMAQIENTLGMSMIEPDISVGHRLGVSIVDAKGRVYDDIVELRPPLSPSQLVIDPGLGPDRLRVSWVKSNSTDVTRYNLYRATSSGGPYTLTNPDPVPHTLYVNTGLTASTIYYYRATAVDSSGNESGMSSIYSGSTNPPQLAGWPIEMKLETNSSPAVGDIDGDGIPEIVQCDDKVYAWHANGVELRDGDGDAQTWGVFSALGSVAGSPSGGYVSHPALAQMDLVPGLEIIAASRDTKEVYIFKKDGSVLSGWPRALENTIRAGMVVGDMDGDGKNEVIAVDEHGVIYVWHANGTELIDGDSNPGTQGVFYRMTGCTLNYSTPCLADIDGDGKNELIVGSQGDQLFAFNENGTSVPGFPYALTSDIAGSPAIGDIDNDGQLEIAVWEMNGNFRILRNNGVQQTFQFFQNGNFFGASPVLGNVTGDAKLEIFIAAKNGKLYGIDSVGNFLTGFPVNYNTTGQWTESSPIIADFDGDGSSDILVGDETKYIRAFTATGGALAGFPLLTDDAMRGVPQATDVDGDGKLDLVAAGWDKNVYVWKFNATWNPAKAPWPRFHANLHNNGRIGFVVPTPVAGTRFSFTVAGDRVNLEWFVPLEAGTRFAVDRARVENGSTGAFARIAVKVDAGLDGMVELGDANVEMGERYVYRLNNDTGVVNETNGVYVPVSRADLGQNYPNPFNPATKIEYWVPEGMKAGARSNVNVIVYDVTGARVKTLVSGPKSAGHYVAQWDGRDDRGTPVSSGIYFYRMTSGSFAAVRKMVLLK
ncbi:MAG TPA: C25 family cysteine peptidase [Candidatus Krumholzibacteria bacterium]|nr:C25 family cysteine peptidase [Candidatus Krumholzibacteria bacterium]